MGSRHCFFFSGVNHWLRMHTFISLLIFCSLAGGAFCRTPVSGYRSESSEQKKSRMAWWRQARFGMFIHWGLYAVPGGEWGGNTNHAEWILSTAHIPVEKYEQFGARFNPVHFEASEWVRMAKDAGMKYIVVTSKHHDGFCLWDSKVTEYDILDHTPFDRDILKELSEACKKQEMMLGVYYSIMDWHHPDYLPRRKWEMRSSEGTDYQRYIAYMKMQLRELINRYDPAILWFDGEWENTWTHEEGLKLYDYVRSLKPGIIINNRVDKGRHGMQGTFDESRFAGDFGTPEQEIPATGLDYDWESCMTMNRHWGWNKHDKDFKSTEDLIRKLVDITSKGGNFLLNIGPQPDGTFPQESIDRLRRIGDWMDVYGESIYGTTASPFTRLPWGRCTKSVSGDRLTLYLHVFDWPENRQVVVPGLKNEIYEAFLLGNGQKLKTSPDTQGRIVHLPDTPVNQTDTVVVLRMNLPLRVEKVLPTQSSGGATVCLPAVAAEVHGSAAMESKDGEQNIGRWTDPGTWIRWSFVIRQPDTFTIKAEIAVQAQRSDFEVRVDDQPIRGSVTSTGGYADFTSVTVGRTPLLSPGEHTLIIKPDPRQWQPVNFRSITLEPTQ